MKSVSSIDRELGVLCDLTAKELLAGRQRISSRLGTQIASVMDRIDRARKLNGTPHLDLAISGLRSVLGTGDPTQTYRIIRQLQQAIRGEHPSERLHQKTETEVQPRTLHSEVFVVHGRDEGAKDTVARFLERLGLQPIVLPERPSHGRTIIEKLEAHSNVGFAVVLLTPDDIGGPKDKPDEMKPRARQNVLLELGYFLGRIGRENVCALHKEVEIPSDYMGVGYIPFDSAGGWRPKLIKEIVASGIPIEQGKIAGSQ